MPGQDENCEPHRPAEENFSDGAFDAIFDFGPLPLLNDGPGQPAHGEHEIVQLAQMDIGADGAGVEYLPKVVGLGFDALVSSYNPLRSRSFWD